MRDTVTQDKLHLRGESFNALNKQMSIQISLETVTIIAP